MSEWKGIDKHKGGPYDVEVFTQRGSFWISECHHRSFPHSQNFLCALFGLFLINRQLYLWKSEPWSVLLHTFSTHLMACILQERETDGELAGVILPLKTRNVAAKVSIVITSCLTVPVKQGIVIVAPKSELPFFPHIHTYSKHMRLLQWQWNWSHSVNSFFWGQKLSAMPRSHASAMQMISLMCLQKANAQHMGALTDVLCPETWEQHKWHQSHRQHPRPRGTTTTGAHSVVGGVLPKLTHNQSLSTLIYSLFSIALKTGEGSWGRDMERCPCAWHWWSGLQGGWLGDAAPPGLLGWNGSSKLHASLSCGLWLMVSLEEGLSRGNKGADAIKQAVNHMSAFMANVRICRSIFQAAPAVGR